LDSKSDETVEAFLLHSRRFKETSLIVEFLTLERGRLTVISKGALREKSRIGPSLQPFTRLQLECKGKSELLNLIKAEPLEYFPRINGIRLYSSLYANELLIKLTVPDDPVPEVYAIYQQLLRKLAAETSLEQTLRYFELSVLKAIGLGPILDRVIDTGKLIEASKKYHFVAGDGVFETKRATTGIELTGNTLIKLSSGQNLDHQRLNEAKHLLRYVINYHLEGRELKSRKLFYKKH